MRGAKLEARKKEEEGGLGAGRERYEGKEGEGETVG